MKDCLSQLDCEVGINPMTVAKRQLRATGRDLKANPTEPRSKALKVPKGALIVVVMPCTLLQLKDCLFAIQPSIPLSDAVGAASATARHLVLAGCKERQDQSPDWQAFSRRALLSEIAGPQTAGGKLF